jgi:nicotinamide-nucleotide amidase
MKAEIITIGDEILIGQIVDTNSAWMAEQLNLAGIEVYQITSVHDDRNHIMQALASAEQQVDVVLITGGLGPTKDDITKYALCEYFDTKLVFHEPTFEVIRERFKNRGIDFNKLNRDQALVPESCKVIPNAEGTAPCMWFERNDTIFVSMPGVPFEMKGLMSHEVLPRLLTSGKLKVIVHKTVLTQGVPESMLAIRIEEWENNLPPFIRLAYLPNPTSVRLRLTAIGTDAQLLRQEIDRQVGLLQLLLPTEIFGYDSETMADSVSRLLKAKKQVLAVAESCTGGYISHLLTLIPGASEWYAGGITAYDNSVKTNLLGVHPETLLQYGAVSENTAKEMALGVKEALKSDYAIATTGIAGPDGGTPDKPVGTIWISVAGPTKLIAQKYVFGNNRERNIMRSAQTALQMLRRLILEEPLA